MLINDFEFSTLPPADTREVLLEAVLIFHSGGDWNDGRDLLFYNRVNCEATTKALCNKIREVLRVSRKGKGEDEQDYRYCDKCHCETLHNIHDDGHERDSSNDYIECTVCGNTRNSI